MTFPRAAGARCTLLVEQRAVYGVTADLTTTCTACPMLVLLAAVGDLVLVGDVIWVRGAGSRPTPCDDAAPGTTIRGAMASDQMIDPEALKRSLRRIQADTGGNELTDGLQRVIAPAT